MSRKITQILLFALIGLSYALRAPSKHNISILTPKNPHPSLIEMAAPNLDNFSNFRVTLAKDLIQLMEKIIHKVESPQLSVESFANYLQRGVDEAPYRLVNSEAEKSTKLSKSLPIQSKIEVLGYLETFVNGFETLNTWFKLNVEELDAFEKDIKKFKSKAHENAATVLALLQKIDKNTSKSDLEIVTKKVELYIETLSPRINKLSAQLGAIAGVRFAERTRWITFFKELTKKINKFRKGQSLEVKKALDAFSNSYNTVERIAVSVSYPFFLEKFNHAIEDFDSVGESVAKLANSVMAKVNIIKYGKIDSKGEKSTEVDLVEKKKGGLIKGTKTLLKKKPIKQVNQNFKPVHKRVGYKVPFFLRI